MEINRIQRRDIDNLIDDHIGLTIDENNRLTSPYSIDLSAAEEIIGNNWIIGDDSISKYNLADEDNLRFTVRQDALRHKNITRVRLKFSVECDRDGVTVNDVTLSNGHVDYAIIVKTILYDGADVDIDCELFGLGTDDVNNIINDELFYIIIGFDGKSLNTNMIITNPRLSFAFENKLQGEIEVVKNRLGDLDSDIIGIATFHIDENGHLIASYPTSDKNNYYIDNNGHLIYDTENYHNEGLIT